MLWASFRRSRHPSHPSLNPNPNPNPNSNPNLSLNPNPNYGVSYLNGVVSSQRYLSL